VPFCAGAGAVPHRHHLIFVPVRPGMPLIPPPHNWPLDSASLQLYS
jgi:hypothetical protein